jgi:hypothetical protein
MNIKAFLFFCFFPAHSIFSLNNELYCLKGVYHKAHKIINHDFSLSPSELHVLLDLFHVAKTVIATEHQLQTETNYLLSTVNQFHYRERDIELTDLTCIEDSVLRIKDLVKKREALQHFYTELSTLIETSSSIILRSALAAITAHATDLVNDIVKSHYPSLEAILGDSAQTLKKVSSMAHIIANSFQALHDNEYPLEENQHKNHAIMTLEAAHSFSNTLVNQSNTFLAVKNTLAENIMDIQSITGHIFHVYYQVILEKVKKEEREKLELTNQASA